LVSTGIFLSASSGGYEGFIIGRLNCRNSDRWQTISSEINSCGFTVA